LPDVADANAMEKKPPKRDFSIQTCQRGCRIPLWEFQTLPAHPAHRLMKSPSPCRRREAPGGPNARSAAGFWKLGKAPGWRPIGWFFRLITSIRPPSRHRPWPRHPRAHPHQLSLDL